MQFWHNLFKPMTWNTRLIPTMIMCNPSGVFFFLSTAGIHFYSREQRARGKWNIQGFSTVRTPDPPSANHLMGTFLSDFLYLDCKPHKISKLPYCLPTHEQNSETISLHVQIALFHQADWHSSVI